MEQKDCQRQTKNGVSNPNGNIGAGDPQFRDDRDASNNKALREKLEERNKRELKRNDLEGENCEEDSVAPLEVEPRQRICGKHRQSNGKNHGGNRDSKAVEEVLEQWRV